MNTELISLKTDLFDLLDVQGTLRSLLQHHSSKASVIQRSAFFMVQLSQPYVTTGKTIALTIQTAVGRVMSLLFNTLSGFVIAFLPRSKRLLISWLQSPSVMILEPKERKSVPTSTLSPSICHEEMATHSSVLSWRIPWTEEPGGLQFMGSKRVKHDWATNTTHSNTMGLDAMILLFLIFLVLSWLFHSPPSPSSRGSWVPLCFLSLEWYHPRIWGCWCFCHLSWFQVVTHPAWHFSTCAQRRS